MISLAIIIASLACCPTTAQKFDGPLEVQNCVKMIRGLKERRLFHLAQQYGQSQLESELIQRVDKSTVLNEMIRTKVAHAISSTG